MFFRWIYVSNSLVFAAIGFLCKQKLLSKMKFTEPDCFRRGMTGKDVAEAMLRYNQIYDVQVVLAKACYQIIIILQPRRLIWAPMCIPETV